jgi:hemolysin activation/secretion protein
MATVRGVTEGLMTGDTGYFLNLEARRQLFSYRNKIVVEAFGFLDHGGVFYWFYPAAEHPSDFLFSVGSGLNVNFGRYFSSTIGYGQPIFTAESHREQYREKLHYGNGYFTLRAQF